MALRATSHPAPDVRSAKPGDVVVFRAKVENSGASDETVALAVEGLKDAFAFAFDPPAASVPAKSRSRVEFRWTAALPEGKDALTFRGKLVLRAPDGRLVGDAPLDLYVSGRA